MHIKIKACKLLLIFFFSSLLFAEVKSPSFREFIPNDIFPFQKIDSANRAYVEGDFHKSILLFESLKIDDPTVFYDKANAEYKARMYDEALKDYAKAKGVDEATRLYNMGNCYFKKGNFKLAIKEYTASLRLKNDEDVMHNLKLAREKRKEKDSNKDKKKKDKDKNKKKKRDEEKKKKKKDDRKKDSENKNSNSQKKDKSNKREPENKLSKKEKMRKKELSHLIKQLSKKRMPTMMYQGKENKEESYDKNPW